MTTEEKIKVMQAYVNGEQIQFRRAEEEQWVDVIGDGLELGWDWVKSDYRIKPSLKYRPYKNEKEVLADMKGHGPMIIGNSCQLFSISMIDGSRGVVITDSYGPHFHGYDMLLQLYVWQDGAQLGVLEYN